MNKWYEEKGKTKIVFIVYCFAIVGYLSIMGLCVWTLPNIELTFSSTVLLRAVLATQLWWLLNGFCLHLYWTYYKKTDKKEREKN